jgi:adenine-specific DNA-methyltransferase
MEHNKDYYTKHLFNYIGNKRKLLPFIEETIIEIKKELNKDLITSMDGFSGSGTVSRLLKLHSNKLYVNDLENYSYVINSAYLDNLNENELKELNDIINNLNNIKKEEYIKGNISNYYSPKDDTNIQIGERTFYTNENSQIIDTIRNKIDTLPKKYQKYILAQLLIKSSIHTNTGGIFKGFYKNSKTKKGQFGGNGENALSRIKGKIILETPILSNNNHKTEIILRKKDINILIKEINEELDIVYYDPPYNIHPYGSNYFMLNIIIDNDKNYKDKEISEVSGIPKDWNKSNYNYKNKSKKSMIDLIINTKSKYILISYNEEGIISFKEWIEMLEKLEKEKGYLWRYKIKEYNTYKGSRNLKNRKKKIKEIIWIIKK